MYHIARYRRAQEFLTLWNTELKAGRVTPEQVKKAWAETAGLSPEREVVRCDGNIQIFWQKSTKSFQYRGDDDTGSFGFWRAKIWFRTRSRLNGNWHGVRGDRN